TFRIKSPNWPATLDSPVLSPSLSRVLRMHESGLIEKLLVAGVIEKRIHELKFTDGFCKHLVYCNHTYGFKGGGTLEVWRKIIVEYDAKLEALSDKEIATTIVLLDYFLDKLTTGKA
ncbi:MAG: hypothetical protein MN733_44225, partial [Nitrososphaera sp.]|nr:hypothetical protein [Nitrososphaera sp.]